MSQFNLNPHEISCSAQDFEMAEAIGESSINFLEADMPPQVGKIVAEMKSLCEELNVKVKENKFGDPEETKGKALLRAMKDSGNVLYAEAADRITQILADENVSEWTCPPIDIISALATRPPSQSLPERLQKHMESCDHCFYKYGRQRDIYEASFEIADLKAELDDQEDEAELLEWILALLLNKKRMP